MTDPNKTIIPPTVGRVVHYYRDLRTGESGFAVKDDGQPYAAIIAHVWSDTMVNLTVFDANGTPHSRTSVELVQGPQPAPLVGAFCNWMPYQIGQAAKTEQTLAAANLHAHAAAHPHRADIDSFAAKLVAKAVVDEDSDIDGIEEAEQLGKRVQAAINAVLANTWLEVK